MDNNCESSDNGSAAGRVSGTRNSDSEEAEGNRIQPERKSVHFNTKANLYHRASDVSSEENNAVWYTSSEYDNLKCEAAEDANVKIIKCDTKNKKVIQEHHRFAMVGDFDTKSIDAQSSNIPYENIKEHYYNENEYNNSLNKNQEAVSKRGLGYHFSRSRRESKIQTRATVLTWQKALCDRRNAPGPESERGPPRIGGGAEKIDDENSRLLMLALISAKYSHVARVEAKWRGDVDYMVAYPERCKPPVVPSSRSRNGKRRSAARRNNGAIAKKRRRHTDAEAIPHKVEIGCKRRRTVSVNRVSWKQEILNSFRFA